MTKIFISGSMGIKRIDAKVKERIDNIINSNFQILLGDASGVDTSIQELIKSKEYEKVTVYCSGDHVRNNIGVKCIAQNVIKNGLFIIICYNIRCLNL